jgi:hypothetical protein
MRLSSFLKKILFSSSFLAIIPAFIVMMFLPSLGTKSRLHIEPLDINYENYTFADLNSDSISEVVKTGKGDPYFFALILNNDMQVYDQWNLRDSINPDLSDFFFGNFDNDRYSEIYIFTYKDDSLFLNINEFFDPDGMRLDRVYITKIGIVNKKVTSNIFPAGFFDSNGDGKDELFFSIHTGFGLQPRTLYSFDIVNKELKSSQLTGVICKRPKMFDSDGDGRPEFFGSVGASGNFHSFVPFNDMSSWLMIFDDSLRFEFPPVEFQGLTNIMETDSYSYGSFNGYVALHYTSSADTTVLKPRILLYSLTGEKVREVIFSDIGLDKFRELVVIRKKSADRIFVLGKDLLEFNDQLVVKKKVKSPFKSEFEYYILDIDFDGKDELVLYSLSEEKLVIYNTALQKIAETNLNATNKLIRFSHYSSRDLEEKIFLNAGRYGYFLKLENNYYYYLGYLAYPGIYFLILLFVIFIKRISAYQVIHKESLKRRLVTLQLQGIKSQLDPHFTFNAINSVASLVYLEDREAAYDYLTKFTQLLRSIVNDAENIYRSLEQELEFVTVYLELEKLRFGEKFNYEIVVGEGISRKALVPKMVLHTFAENAVKHGIMPAANGGLLKISIDKEDDYLKLSIEDNGIGREAASGKSDSSGKGLQLTGEFFDILNQINKKPIKHLLTDLYSETGEPAGTRVEVWVPVEEEEQDKRQK